MLLYITCCMYLCSIHVECTCACHALCAVHCICNSAARAGIERENARERERERERDAGGAQVVVHVICDVLWCMLRYVLRC